MDKKCRKAETKNVKEISDRGLRAKIFNSTDIHKLFGIFELCT